MNSNKGDLSLKIPNGEKFDAVDVLDNKVIYSGKNSKFDVVVEAVGGGLRQVINIKSNDAPSFYDFPVELAEGDKLELTENGGAMITGTSLKPANFKVEDLPKDLDRR